MARALAGANGAKGEELDDMTQIVRNLEQSITRLRSVSAALESQKAELERRRARSQASLNELLALRQALVRAYPEAGQLDLPIGQQSLDGEDSRLAGVSLGEAIERILRREGRAMTQGELADALEQSGFTLGEFAGRQIHAATLSNDQIKKPRSKTYVYIGEEELVSA